MLRNANIGSHLTTVGYNVMSFGIKCLRAVAIKSTQTKRQQMSTTAPSRPRKVKLLERAETTGDGLPAAKR
jgi:hypothetical protein